ncbi:archaellum component FlaG (FlaF/FlaG flagellin family) [Okibacterium sp. HSC-33S16]|uniref:hypothetical protein n=1 Tax=Okibacterium sp. HSC-33S16 TaxID=2910965 RepID=UPI0020A21475|nr:hypothetical protein [Okibacterium sp. HSC-33S16]MCP2030160.1 archaellum component FlaG (FlaF/FlaG flagellin family) [Okibacterium sp. HSC-33S16]
MKARLIASVALAATVVFGATGCNLVSPQATTGEYDPSDGVSVDVGDLRLNNMIVLTEDGTNGNLIFTAKNTGSAHSVSLQFGDDDTTVTTVIDGETSTVFGGEENEPIALEGIETQPGALLPLFVQYGNETGKKVLVPVLDGSIPPYDELLPASSESE